MLTRSDFFALLLAEPAAVPGRKFSVVAPGTHPGPVFSAAHVDALRRRSRAGGMAGDA
jgi:hypothetical protein